MHQYERIDPKTPNLLNAILYGENENFDINKEKILNLFFQKQYDDGSDHSKTYIQEDCFYTINKQGFRSPNNFSKNIDILTLGCSFTHGTGINEENLIWTNYLSNKLNMKNDNLAMGGDSAIGQVIKAFKYFKEFGHPKYIVALFPTMGRFIYTYNKKFYENSMTDAMTKHRSKTNKETMALGITKINCEEYVHETTYIDSTFNIIPENQPIFSKRPHKIDDVISEDLAFFYNMQFIFMLREYCRSHGIKFIWSTWDENFPSALKKIELEYPELKNLINEEYSEMIDVEMLNWKFNYNEEINPLLFIDEYYLHDEKISCHEKYSNYKEFNLGLDRQYGIRSSHWGLHRHLHVAEKFEKAIKEKFLNE